MAYVFSSTFASNGASHGGAIALRDRAKLEMHSSTLIENHADRYGGAIYARDESSIHIQSSIFRSNHHDKGSAESSAGGALYLQEKVELDIYSTSFFTNSAGQGGVMYAHGKDVKAKIRTSIFDGNMAYGFYAGGGAIVADGAQVEADACSFLSNKAKAGSQEYKGSTCRSVAIMQCASSLQALCSTDADCRQHGRQFTSEGCYACNSVSDIRCLVAVSAHLLDQTYLT